jgi:aryl-alcohol dehydrogenase-like predicted oxidoreductase
LSKAAETKMGPAQLHVSRVCFGTEHINVYTPDYGGNLLADAAKLYNVFFWDTDMVYGSHPQVAAGLKKVNRDEVVVCSKTYALTEKDCRKDLERIYRELDTEYLDICLLHRVTVSPEHYQPALNVLIEEKKKGHIRTVGLSTHHVKVVEECISVPQIEIVCAPVNRDGSRIDQGSRDGMIDALRLAHDAGKGTYVIKILGRGDLVKDVQGAIEWVLQHESFIDVFNIGVANLAELQQDVDIVNRYLKDQL